MITVRAIGICLLLVTAGCSREQQDWRSAEAADSIDSYGQFIQRHPDSELVTQARARIVQLGEDRDWQRAGSADTVDAYREFIAQHPSGRWAQEAHIRVENFSLGEQAGTDAGSKVASAAGGARGAPPSDVSGSAAGGAHSYGLAQPGDAASPARQAPAATGIATAAGPNTATGTRVGPGTAAGPTATGTTVGPSTAAATAIVGQPGARLLRADPTPLSPSATAAFKAELEAARAKAVANAAGKGAYGIQLGAYSNEASASAQWRVLTTKYASDLLGLQQHVVPADTGSGRIYRLQATVGDEGRARAICDQLKKHGQACVAVLPH